VVGPDPNRQEVPAGKFSPEDANGGHGHRAWECRRPLALLLGHLARRHCPSGALSLWCNPHRVFPTFSAVGWDDITLELHRDTI